MKIVFLLIPTHDYIELELKEIKLNTTHVLISVATNNEFWTNTHNIRIFKNDEYGYEYYLEFEKLFKYYSWEIFE